MLRWLRRLILLMLLAGIVAGAAYVHSEGFSHRWRQFVMEQFAQRGIYLTLQRLTLDPLEGIVAQGIQVYQDKEHHVPLASVDRLNLNLDYAKLARSQPFLEDVDLRNASLSLALDPKDPHSEKLELSGLNARISIVGDRIDIRKAEGNLLGILVDITGSLLRPDTPTDPEQEKKDREASRKRMEALRAQRPAFENLYRTLREIDIARRPTLALQVSGDLSHPERLSASLRFTADGLHRGAYTADKFEIDATYADQTVDLTRLYLKDHLGELRASATYSIGAPAIDFHVRSGADLPALAAEVLHQDALREVVFYEPIEILADGEAYLNGAPATPTTQLAPPKALPIVENDGPATGPKPVADLVPLRCTGRLHTGRFASRGQVIDGFSLNFGLAPEGCYLRDLLIRHKSGTAGLTAMWRRDEGLHYRLNLRMNPHVFLPFIADPHIHEIINPFEFRDDSTIAYLMEGAGPTLDIGDAQNQCKAELHNFKYKGVEVSSITADMDFHLEQHNYHNLVIERPEGRATAAAVNCDDEVHTIKLTNVVCDCDPAAIVSCFNRDIAASINKYRFDRHPHAEADGIIGLDDRPSDFHVKFRSEGLAHYSLWDEDYTVHRPAGALHFKGSNVTYDVAGAVFGKDMNCKGIASLDEKVNDYTVDLHAGLFPYKVFSKTLAFTNMQANIVCRKGLANFDAKATVMDGKFNIKGLIDDRKVRLQPYQGELTLDALSFKKFTQTYTSDFDSEGDLTGHFSFYGKLGDWKTLHGNGAMVILNSNLYAVPILGPLTPLLGAVLPRPIKNFNLAKEADATFSVADGVIHTNDIAALTQVFRIVSRGQINFIDDKIKFTAEAKFRGLPGLVLFPVSTIFEYVSEGSVENPVWRSRFFSAPPRADARKPGEERATSASAPSTAEPSVPPPTLRNIR